MGTTYYRVVSSYSLAMIMLVMAVAPIEPPATTTEAQIDQAIEIIGEALEAVGGASDRGRVV